MCTSAQTEVFGALQWALRDRGGISPPYPPFSLRLKAQIACLSAGTQKGRALGNPKQIATLRKHLKKSFHVAKTSSLSCCPHLPIEAIYSVSHSPFYMPCSHLFTCHRLWDGVVFLFPPNGGTPIPKANAGCLPRFCCPLPSLRDLKQHKTEISKKL